MMAAPVSIIVGAPISNRLLALDGLLGLHGWQWLFLLEGFPAIVLGVFALRALTESPVRSPLADRPPARVAHAHDGRRAETPRSRRTHIVDAKLEKRTRLVTLFDLFPSTRWSPTGSICGFRRC
jgi:MFS family permease